LLSSAAEDFPDNASIIGFFTPGGAAENNTFTYIDNLSESAPSDLNSVRLRYAVAYVNAQEQNLGFTNSVVIEPVSVVAGPPENVKVEQLIQDEIVVSWAPPSDSEKLAAAGRFLGYNVYRKVASGPLPNTPLNDQPVQVTRYRDRSFQFQTEYNYIVRSVVQAGGRVIESSDSPAQTFKPVDRFPPSAPTAVQIASAAGIISLFWPSNPEGDVVGYNIYRAESESAPDDKWIKLNQSPIQATSFRDDRVQVGKRYYYRLTAIDRSGNEGPRSEIRSEEVVP